jgi:HD-GYP domain-containing protein (c-di-GMP phosphodiesterase class II)
MLPVVPASQVRLAELIAALSLGIDLGFGQPMEHVLRQCLIALRLAEQIGLDEQVRSDVYFTALLVNVGCHSDAHEQAKWFGDDITIKAAKYRHGFGLRGAAAAMGMLGAGKPPLHRFRLGLEFMIAGHREMDVAVHARVARALGEHLGLRDAVLESLGAAYERWDGRGWPGKLAGADIPLPSRIVSIAEFMEVAHRMGGSASATAFARKESGKQFDPALVKLVCEHAGANFDGIYTTHTWKTVIDAEPALAVVLSETQFDAALLAIANFVDLKVPYSLGHSANLAELAGGAASILKLPAVEVQTLRRAGLVQGFGRLGISNAIWDKPGPLGAGEWERVRMQPYITERMLHQSAALAPLGAIAAQHRERIDGSGYPHGISGGAIPISARILGAADAYQAMREMRPYRAARLAEQAAQELRNEVRAGRLDGDAVEAVLNAAGHRARRRPEQPAGLTARELEVLRLLAHGLSTKEIAARLTLSPKTAGNHIEHIYSKIAVSNRAAVCLFAVQHGLLTVDG